MQYVTPRVIRYGLGGLVVVWTAAANISIVAFIYGVATPFIPMLPPLTVSEFIALVQDPRFALFFVGVCTALTLGGTYRYGSLSAFILASAKRADQVLDRSLFDEPLLRGRIRHDGIAWTFEYCGDDHIEIVERNCPRCGLGLEESYLPRHVVDGPDTAFDRGQDITKTEEETWTDVFGTEKFEDRDETLALACPQCNVSRPGRADVWEGKDGAVAKFQRHVELMRSNNPRGDSFAEYVDRFQSKTGGDPTPEGIWDMYVESASESEDLLAIGVSQLEDVEEQEGDR